MRSLAEEEKFKVQPVAQTWERTWGAGLVLAEPESRWLDAILEMGKEPPQAGGRSGVRVGRPQLWVDLHRGCSLLTVPPLWLCPRTFAQATSSAWLSLP